MSNTYHLGIDLLDGSAANINFNTNVITYTDGRTRNFSADEAQAANLQSVREMIDNYNAISALGTLLRQYVADARNRAGQDGRTIDFIVSTGPSQDPGLGGLTDFPLPNESSGPVKITVFDVCKRSSNHICASSGRCC